jgi:hypothetical protein
MFRKNTLWISIMPVVLGFLLLLAFGQALSRPAVQADPTSGWEEGRPVTSEDAAGNIVLPSVATAPGTLYRTFSGTRFQPTSSALTYAASAGAIYATALPPGGYSFSLDFDLPSGATITEVVFFVIDNDTTNMDLSLRSYKPETDAFITLESASSSGASQTLQIIVVPVDPPIQVDNTTTSYRLRVAPGVGSSAHLLRGARIGYTVPVLFLPLIAR